MSIITRFIIIVAVLFCCEAKAQESYSRARIMLDGRSVFELLQQDITLDHGVHNKNYIENDFSASELQRVAAAGFRYEVVIPNVSDYYSKQNEAFLKNIQGGASCATPSSLPNPSYQTPANFRLGTMGGYYTYQELLNELDSMRAKYPQLISTRQVINPADLTHEGRPIYWLRISDNPNVDETEPEALYNALHHAREPMSLSQLVFFMWYLLENYNSDLNIKYLLDNTELYFVPCINPDGYIYNQNTNPNGGGMWRKNRRNNGNNIFGVDLNRNYGYNWGFDNQGSSPTNTSDTYRGPAAFSEPETRNVRDFCLAHDFKICFNYHSYGNLLVYPWAFTGLETPDSVYYRNVAPMLTRFNKFNAGTGVQTVGYNSNGDADDWQYGEQITKAKTLSMTPEVGTSDYGFWPPTTEIETICKSTLWQNLGNAYLLLNFGLAEDRSPALLTQLVNPIAFELKRYGFSNGNLTVSLLPLSANIVNVGNSKTFTLNQLQAANDSISLELNSGVQNGDLVRFIMQVDNGLGLVLQDTITKTFGAYSLVLNDAGNAMNNWINLGTASNWQLTTSSFYSAPSSITDSEGDDYANSDVSDLLLRYSIDLRGVSDASLSFWAKWNIEDDYDYVQISAANASGNFIPLCGRYTQLGTAYQTPGDPVFDGQQSNWVQENMSLNDFLGDSAVVIKISLRSDQWVRADGFYFDDMTVSVLQGNPAGTGMQRRTYPLLGQNIPNPASENIFIPFQNLDLYGLSDLKLQVTDVLGRIMVLLPVNELDKGINVEIGDWPSGTYFYRLIGEKGCSETLPMSISR